jgi:hypothetical protein
VLNCNKKSEIKVTGKKMNEISKTPIQFSGIELILVDNFQFSEILEN